MKYVLMYLFAIVLANLSSAAFGPGASVVNAFLFIGLDLTARDRLHEQWKHKHLARNMAMLIAAGSVLSFIVDAAALPIAIASLLAFSAANVADTLVYHLLGKFHPVVKVNGSNAVSALADSLIFPTVAFGGFLPLITLGQWVAKVAGGFVWSLILNHFKGVRNATH